MGLVTESAAVAPSAVADAERVPFRSGSMEAVFMECVLSAVSEKRAVLGEVVRVLCPGGSFVLSDVVVEGTLPAPLDSFAGWLACAAGALSTDGYAALLGERGLTVEVREDHRAAMSEMLAQIGRRLGLFRGAMSAGLVDLGAGAVDEGLIELGERLVATAKQAVECGVLGYALFVARTAS